MTLIDRYERLPSDLEAEGFAIVAVRRLYFYAVTLSVVRRTEIWRFT